MALLFPRVGLARVLADLAGDTLTLRLFSNDVTPAATDTSASYTEVTGGGYSAIALTGANWTAVSNVNPVYMTYNAFLTFNFTGTTGGGGDIYGYYITRASGEVVAAQQFPVASRPFTPVNGSYVKIKPRITCDNA